MPSSFETEFADAADELMDEFGRAAVYISPRAGVSNVSSIKVRLINEQPTVGVGDDGVTHDAVRAQLKVLVSDVALPLKDGRFLVDSVEYWTITEDPRRRGGMWVCEVERSGRDSIAERREKRA